MVRVDGVAPFATDYRACLPIWRAGILPRHGYTMWAWDWL
ncbi:hypothetical protein B0G83_118138 [Paraburkholderia sp. BL21I4N1]|nr:hypothetical protein B0G83_118138 [Paraburkholderia sp. BL21I4N1]